MKYKCLVFDHDDTVVNSTATIHHPSFQAFLDLYRPGMVCSYEDYLLKNFEPGFLQMCRDEYSMTEEELADELLFWKSYVAEHIPDAYSGMKEIMEKQRAEGGLICVVSHSFEHNIRRDYEHNDLPAPDMVFGWDYPEDQRKPNPYPLERIMETYDLKPDELLMIDDLKPGYDMAQSCGADFAAAGWSYDVEQIENFMRQNCQYYFKSVEKLAEFLK